MMWRSAPGADVSSNEARRLVSARRPRRGEGEGEERRGQEQGRCTSRLLAGPGVR